VAGMERLGLAGEALRLHASLRSFPRLEEGPVTLVGGLLEAVTSVLVATMANGVFSIPPPPGDRPDRNGVDCAGLDEAARTPWPGQRALYDQSSTEVDGVAAWHAAMAEPEASDTGSRLRLVRSKHQELQSTSPSGRVGPSGSAASRALWEH
jgi:hypothetical protein